MSGEADITSLKALEFEFSAHPAFGDWRRILGRNVSYYELMLGFLGKSVPSANALCDRLKLSTFTEKVILLTDVSVRSTIDLAIIRHYTAAPVDDAFCSKLFEQTASFRFSAAGRASGPLRPSRQNYNLAEYSPFPFDVWSNDDEDDVFSEAYRKIYDREIKDVLYSEPVMLLEPAAQQIDALTRACSLLYEVMPSLSESILAHVRFVNILNAPEGVGISTSFSNHNVPGTFYLMPVVLRNLYKCAETILHESLHKKLSDVVRGLGSRIFRQDYSQETAACVRAVWNRNRPWNSNEWPIDRVLYACHVYVHVALFYRLVGLRICDISQRYGGTEGVDPGGEYRTAALRARYLSKALAEVGGADLGVDGLELAKWLTECLDIIAPTTSPESAEIDLILDRFDTITRNIDRLINISPSIQHRDDEQKLVSMWSEQRHMIKQDVRSACKASSASVERFDREARRQRTMMPTTEVGLIALIRDVLQMRNAASATFRSTASSTLSGDCNGRPGYRLIDSIYQNVELAEACCDQLTTSI